jgi:sulfite reductase (NADPH) flavoprotein alpha-component
VAISQALAVAAPDVDVGRLVMARRFRGGTVLMRAAGEQGGVFAVTESTATALIGDPSLIKQIHEGTWAGSWSGALNFAVSLALLGLTITGSLSWFRRWRRSRRGPMRAGADIAVAHVSQSGTAAHLATATAKVAVKGGERVALAPLGTVSPRQPMMEELRTRHLPKLIAGLPSSASTSMRPNDGDRRTGETA